MKKIFTLFSILMLGFLILTGCDEATLPNISGDIIVTAFKTSFTVKTTFVDSEAHDLYYGNVRAIVIVECENDDSKLEEFTRSTITVNKPKVEEPEDGSEAVIPFEMNGADVTINSLAAGTEYTLRLVISASGSQKTIKTVTATTIDNGASEEDPILISNLEELIGMNKENEAYYKLTADIDCEEQTLQTIFNSSTYFKGHFDGNNHTISNFRIQGNNYAGLFGYMQGATVKDLNLKGVSFVESRGQTYLGALAGYAKNCTISNVQVDGASFTYTGRTTSEANIAGFVGEAVNCKISDCNVSGLVLTISSAQLLVRSGGFVALNNKSDIDKCFVEGTMKATITYNANTNGGLFIGGFAGINDSSLGIEDSYAKVDITVTEPATVTSSGVKTHSLFVGGFVAANDHYQLKVTNCVAMGKIDVSALYTYNAYVGGFVGGLDKYEVSRVSNCAYIPVDTGLTVKFMKEEAADEETGEVKMDQTAYVSLAIGNINDKSKEYISNVIVFKDSISIENQHSKLVETPYAVGENVSAFSEYIQGIISKLTAAE